MKDIYKRLMDLEKIIKNNGELKIWIDGKNATIRVDIERRRGEPITFPSVYEAGRWLDKQIGQHSGGILSYKVDNICDLYENAQELRAVIKDIIPGVIEAPRSGGCVINGQIQPFIVDADNHFSAILPMLKLKPGTPANIRFFCLANLIERYFDDWQFIERWKAGALNNNDGQMMLATYIVFSWNDPRGKSLEVFDDFMRLFFQVLDLPPHNDLGVSPKLQRKTLDT